MAAIPRYRPNVGPAILSAGFRPFFLVGALWSALALPVFVAYFIVGVSPPTSFPLIIWHQHEMVFGFGGAVVAGFLFTAIPNWTGRMPLQGPTLGALVLFWLAGRASVFVSALIGAAATGVFDLAFPLVFLLVILREIVAGQNWRNVPIAGALACLLIGNLLTHLEQLRIYDTAELGNRMGVATLLMLIALIGGRIVPSFTRNWLVKEQPDADLPASFGPVDRVALAATLSALLAFVAVPQAPVAAGLEIMAGIILGLRLTRWRSMQTLREPLLWILHLGYAWLALGLLLLGVSGITSTLPQSAALHALTAGAIGTMTLAVMTRASLGHTGRPLAAGARTKIIYASVTLAALVRVSAPFWGGYYTAALLLAASAWSVAFGLFVFCYFPVLSGPRLRAEERRPV